MAFPGQPILWVAGGGGSLRKTRDVIGLPVIVSETGKQIGTVRDLLFDGRQNLRGVLLERDGWVRRGRFIAVENIAAFGSDAVMIHSEEAVSPLGDEQRKWVGLLSGERKLRGRPVIMANGRELGWVEDVYFREELGTLIGYELSDGFLADVRNGRKVLRPGTMHLTWGEDVIIAPDDDISLQDTGK
jgi:uncharacterized protein YrrD